jgi:YVTN family beta-propeller protein
MQIRKESLPTAADVAILHGEPAAHGVVIEPSSRLAYVTRSEAKTVDIFEPEKMVLIKRIPVADDPDAIFYDEFDKLVYVANGDSHLATLIDPSTQTTVVTIPLGGAPEYATLDASTRLLYQNLHDTNRIVAVDIAKRAVVQGWPLQGCEAPTGMAIDEIHRRLFIGCGANARSMTSRITRSIGCFSNAANIAAPFSATDTMCECLRKKFVSKDRMSSSSSTSSRWGIESILQGQHALVAG